MTGADGLCQVLMFEYSCASRACHLGCPASTRKGCGKKCAKVSGPPSARSSTISKRFSLRAQQIAPPPLRTVWCQRSPNAPNARRQVRWPAIEARLRSQGFQVDYAQCVHDVLAGNRPAIYDVVMFAKRAGSLASTSARDQAVA